MTPVSPAKSPGRWGRWVRFLDEREPGTTLAVFRVPVALCLVLGLGDMIVRGAVPGVWLGADHGGFRPDVPPPWPFALIGGVTPVTVWGMVAVTLLTGTLLALGLGGRAMALAALWSFLSVSSLNRRALGAYDGLLTNALWLVFLSRSTATLSLDCRLRTGRWTSDEPVPAWPRRVALVQLVLMYFSTGLQKISVHWTPLGDCSALYEIMQQPTWQRWDMSWLAYVYPLTQAATLGIWLWELATPLFLLGLWLQRPGKTGRLAAVARRVPFRALFVCVGVPMHLSLALFVSVGPFSGLTMAFYVCLFRPAEWSAILTWAWGLVPGPLRGRLGVP